MIKNINGSDTIVCDRCSNQEFLGYLIYNYCIFGKVVQVHMKCVLPIITAQAKLWGIEETAITVQRLKRAVLS